MLLLFYLLGIKLNVSNLSNGGNFTGVPDYEFQRACVDDVIKALSVSIIIITQFIY